jgi:hypothetical protein
MATLFKSLAYAYGASNRKFLILYYYYSFHALSVKYAYNKNVT